MGKHDPSKSLLKTTFSKQESTVTLKVPIHCEGCKRKVKRIIRCVDGVDSVNIDPENGKVTVVGSGVDAREVLNSLHKAGKQAEIWQFGGGKQLPVGATQPVATTTAKNNHRNSNAEKGKMASQESQNKNMDHGKGKASPDASPDGGRNPGVSGGKAKGGGDMIELAILNPSLMVPPPKPPLADGGGFSHGGSVEKPILATNNVAILSKSVAPRPTVYHGESSFSPPHSSAYASAEYATHLFSDENANNCSVM